MSFLTLVIIVIIVVLFLNLLRKRPTITYKHEFFNIKLKDVKDLPEWLEKFDHIEIKKTTKIEHYSYRNVESSKYTYDLYWDDDDDEENF